MSILILSDRDPKAWLKALKSADPELEVRVYPEDGKKEDIEFALVWNYQHGLLKNYSQLKVVASMGAGVDHILSDPDLPENVQVTRIVDTQLASDMAEFILAAIFDYLRNLSFHREKELEKTWKPKSYHRIADVKVGIMGLGHLGTTAARTLHSLGFKINGWSRTPKDLEFIKSFSGTEELNAFLSESNILVCLLPLTPETENILDKEVLRQLPKNAYLINVARGRHLVEEDLLQVINSEHLAGATLDVFREEPLPKNHPFWGNPKIKVTPHIASVTKPSAVASQVVDNYHRMKKGDPLKNTVEISKGY